MTAARPTGRRARCRTGDSSPGLTAWTASQSMSGCSRRASRSSPEGQRVAPGRVPILDPVMLDPGLLAAIGICPLTARSGCPDRVSIVTDRDWGLSAGARYPGGSVRRDFDSAPIKMPGIQNWTSCAVLSAELAAVATVWRPRLKARTGSSAQASGAAGPLKQAGQRCGVRRCRAGWSAGQVQDGVGVLGGLGQYGDRLCRGHDDQVDLAAAGLFVDVLHHRQRAIGAGADHQPATPPGDVLGGRQRGVAVGAAELAGSALLALADLPAVDDQVVVIGHAVDLYRTE